VSRARRSGADACLRWCDADPGPLRTVPASRAARCTFSESSLFRSDSRYGTTTSVRPLLLKGRAIAYWDRQSLNSALSLRSIHASQLTCMDASRRLGAAPISDLRSPTVDSVAVIPGRARRKRVHGISPRRRASPPLRLTTRYAREPGMTADGSELFVRVTTLGARLPDLTDQCEQGQGGGHGEEDEHDPLHPIEATGA
jgi:hypothetical protein